MLTVLYDVCSFVVVVVVVVVVVLPTHPFSFTVLLLNKEESCSILKK